MANALSEWIHYESEARGWSLREIGRRSGLSAATISKLARGERNEIERKTWEGLARAFEMTVDEVMARAGMMPDRGDVLPELKAWSDKLRQFSPADRERFVAVVDQLFVMTEPQVLQNPEWRQLDA